MDSPEISAIDFPVQLWYNVEKERGIMQYYQGDRDYLALCFSKSDRKSAEKLASCLQQQRVRIWSSSRGCALNHDEDGAYFQQSRAAVILISAAWCEEPLCRAQLQIAAKLEKDMVLVFLDQTDLSADAVLAPLLSRSVRMVDYNAAAEQDFCDAMLSLLCVRDCIMDADEQPEKKSGLFGFLK